MKEAKAGDSVRLHYTGTLGNGKEFDSSRGRAPLAFTLGSGQVIPGFDVAVTGMRVGEKKTVTIPAVEAYGERQNELVVEMPLSRFPDHIRPEVGQELEMARQGDRIHVVVREVSADTVVLDANHPLAGEDLTFQLELVGID
jgi:peptidylprolyl isomerase